MFINGQKKKCTISCIGDEIKRISGFQKTNEVNKKKEKPKPKNSHFESKIISGISKVKEKPKIANNNVFEFGKISQLDGHDSSEDESSSEVG